MPLQKVAKIIRDEKPKTPGELAGWEMTGFPENPWFTCSKKYIRN